MIFYVAKSATYSNAKDGDYLSSFKIFKNLKGKY